MSAISAAAMRCRTMADGSLRIEVEVEPTSAQAAFALFGRPGAPMAIAALKDGHARVGEETQEDKPKGGELAKLAGRWCKDPGFLEWLSEAFPGECQAAVNFLNGAATDEQIAAEMVRNICCVESRAELDTSKDGGMVFHERIRIPYAEFMKAGAR